MINNCRQGHLLSEGNLSSRGKCKKCKYISDARWRRANPEKSAAYTKKYRDKHPNVAREFHLRKQYGIGLEEQQRMLDLQGGKCVICKVVLDSRTKNTTPHIDHVHDNTKRIRGILCHSCNAAIGNFKEDVSLLLRAVEYMLGRLD